MQRPSKKLLSEWYRKAKKSGFTDIEQNDEPERLKKWHSHYWQARFTPDQFESRQDYYRLAAQLAEHGEFETGTHKKIWTLHSQGMPIRDIVKKVGKSKTTVGLIINKYRKGFCK